MMMSLAPRATRALTLCVTICLPSLLHASEIEEVRFSRLHEAPGVTLQLHCVGTLHWMYVIKAYVAALYIDPQVTAEQVLADVAKRLEINYFHAITAQDFAKATDLAIAANSDTAALAGLRARIDALNGLYRDITPGDRYALTYVPGHGTALSLNDQVLGTIPGADFARAVFAIWLGAKPLDTSLKSQLLSCS